MPISTENTNTLLRVDFDDDNSSEAVRLLLDNEYIEFAPGGGQGGSDAIRVKYVGFEQGSHHVVERLPLSRAVEVATLSFDVFFEDGFQWTLGGKLHGLGPEKWVTGGNERLPDGWSARMMFKSAGHVSTYLYDQNREEKYGVGKESEKSVFSVGRWHRVDIEVSLNTPGLFDGFARVIVDGQEATRSMEIRYRDVGGGETLIQKFLFSTFHGGNALEWMPVDEAGNSKTVYARFDNFLVTEGLLQDRRLE